MPLRFGCAIGFNGFGGCMTDLQINIALAQACGWLPSSKYAIMHGQYQVFRQILTCNKDGTLRKFDYRDPVIFTAICKHWKLNVDHKYMTTCYSDSDAEPTIYIREKNGLCIEKAVALCVIEATKRGLV
jgi:hypothetical protein